MRPAKEVKIRRKPKKGADWEKKSFQKTNCGLEVATAPLRKGELDTNTKTG